MCLDSFNPEFPTISEAEFVTAVDRGPVNKFKQCIKMTFWTSSVNSNVYILNIKDCLKFDTMGGSVAV